LLSRTPVQCLHRWTKILKPGLIKGPWTIEEDRKLKEWVNNQGPAKWSQCSDFLIGRSGKQCRERWFNTLNPTVKKGGWTALEDYTIFSYFAKHGSKWSKISNDLNGRTENSIKNRFYSTLRRISSDIKKTNQNTKSSINSKLSGKSLEDLLQFFPIALEEKTQMYKNWKTMQLSALKAEQNEVDEDDDKMLSKKTKRNENARITNINNTYNINVNVNNNKPSSFSPKINDTNNLEELEKVIDKWCCEDIEVKSDNFYSKIENKISTILDKRTQPVHNKEIINKSNEKLNLLEQLNELELLLQNTKKKNCT